MSQIHDEIRLGREREPPVSARVIVSSLRSSIDALVISVFVVIGFEFALILWTTGGNFTYTIDDAYIHLALAENIARFGHYGINLQEFASPSSSILWPLLLVPFFYVGLGSFGPLILNVVCALGSLVLIRRFLNDVAELHGHRNMQRELQIFALFIFFLCDGFGIIFTGMEHSLQVFVAILVVYLISQRHGGMPAESGGRDRKYSSFLLVSAIVVCPLVRFEGLAVSLFALIMLVQYRELRLVIISTALLAGAFAVYFYVMSLLGLPLLPSSVLVKSRAAADLATQTGVIDKIISAAGHVAGNFEVNLSNPQAVLLLLIASLLILGTLLALHRRERNLAVYALAACTAILLQLVFGSFGWYPRYQSYVCAVGMCAAIFVFSGVFFAEAEHKSAATRTMQQAMMAALVVVAVLSSYQQSFMPLAITPIAAENIHDQHYQMHVFATRYWKSPVAVNDLGYVSFENDQYVLDLVGLGSEEARRLTRDGDDDFFAAIVKRHNVHFAMLYEKFFPGRIPSDWVKIGDLRLTSISITPGDRRVSFYIFGVGETECSATVDALTQFSATLPPHAALAIYANACSSFARGAVRQAL